MSAVGMSAKCQKQTCAVENGMSALTPKADISDLIKAIRQTERPPQLLLHVPNNLLGGVIKFFSCVAGL